MTGEVPRFDTSSAASLDERTTWGLPGDNYLFVIGAGFVSVICFVMATAARQPLLVRLGMAMVPMGLCGVYLFVAVIGKPPHYSIDWFAKLGRSKSFGMEPQSLESRRTPEFLKAHGQRIA